MSTLLLLAAAPLLSTNFSSGVAVVVVVADDIFQLLHVARDHHCQQKRVSPLHMTKRIFLKYYNTVIKTAFRFVRPELTSSSFTVEI